MDTLNEEDDNAFLTPPNRTAEAADAGTTMLEFLGQHEEDDSPAVPREPLGRNMGEGDGESPSQAADRLDPSTQGSSSELKDTALLLAQDPEEDGMDEDDDAPEEQQALCSVLNTVVDFVMMPPTGHFEPDEYEQQQQQQSTSLLQVPVLRFFGPLVRRRRSTPSNNDGSLPNNEPQQSACLHVHGAYPYLVARPVAAGPDGSGFEKCCPWDSVAAVQRMLPVLMETLEAAIQETTRGLLMNDNNNNNNPSTAVATSTTSTSTTARAAPKVLRRITVVTGRGFYTYCPGPAAPFLRIEYYAPSDRWKVKRCLERGLADLPQTVYHPAAAVQRAREMEMDDDDVLRFHCYEAHIPYTMQFFKDWNLAGMSYIHVMADESNVRFRTPLPSAPRNKHWHSRRATETSETSSLSSSHLFLASNTPAAYQWSSSSGTATSIPRDDGHAPTESGGPETVAAASSSSAAAARPLLVAWFQGKMTSCDVELDISVSSILNVREVMTDLPKDWETRQKIHWRAVPSLREIWSQERRRMARLLPPKDDFLSCTPEPLPFTLNVKKDAALPGARLACEGMRRLVNVTNGLEESFRRSMKQILERHVEKVNRADTEMSKRNAEAAEASCERAGAKDVLTPSYDEALEALGALGGLLDESPSQSSAQKSANHGADDYQNLSQESAQSSGQLSLGLNRFDALSQDFYPSSRDNANAAKDHSLHDEYMFSQRVERGDGIVVDGPFQHIDDVIDPGTLAPYESIDDEYDGEDNSVVDAHEDSTDTHELERELSALATQIVREKTDHDDDESSVESIDLMVFSTQAIKQKTDGNVDGGGGDGDDGSVETKELLAWQDSLTGNNEAVESDDDEANCKADPSVVATGSSAAPANVGQANQIVGEGSFLLSDQSSSFAVWEHPADITISRREVPPTKGDLIKSATETTLYPKQSAGSSNEWTTYLTSYERMHGRDSARRNWFPTCQGGVDVLPVRAAPTRKAVVSWQRKQVRKREADLSRTRSRSRSAKRSRSGSEHQRKTAALNLRIDENSRKLVVEAALEAPHHDSLEVEEVDWEPSQQELLSVLTQEAETEAKKNSLANPSEKQACSQSTRESDDRLHHSSSSGPTSADNTLTENPSPGRALQGIGNQGGRIWVEGGGQLKARTKQSQRNTIDNLDDSGLHGTQGALSCPVTVMAIEVHIQCREGQAGVNDSRKIAMTPDSDRDRILSAVCVFGRDPGGGESFEFFERICIFVPLEREERAAADENQSIDRFAGCIRRSMPPVTLGVSTPLSVECVKDERQLLLRLASIVRLKDPDMLLSWDTQGSGIGYLIERGVALGKNSAGGDGNGKELDMARLLGRTPTVDARTESNRLGQLFKSEDATGAALAELDHGTSLEREKDNTGSSKWKGSGLGSEWDERVGAGAAAASIVSITAQRHGQETNNTRAHLFCLVLCSAVDSCLRHGRLSRTKSSTQTVPISRLLFRLS